MLLPSIIDEIQMTSRVQKALTAAAVASSGKMPSLIRKQRHGSPTAGIFTRSQHKRSFNSVYSVRPGNNGTTSDTSCASYTDPLQMQKIEGNDCDNNKEEDEVARKNFTISLPPPGNELLNSETRNPPIALCIPRDPTDSHATIYAIPFKMSHRTFHYR
uniref:Uncharacterized protein n=1 Tax=Wuchereria bancrofti TaxID=6293 RepID=A0A1I8EDJ7_WUCBA